MTMKYLDPSYHIRSVPANASDAVFCYLLAEHAVHAGMAGKTDMLLDFGIPSAVLDCTRVVLPSVLFGVPS